MNRTFSNPFKIICPPAGHERLIRCLLDGKEQFRFLPDTYVPAVLFLPGGLARIVRGASPRLTASSAT